MNYREVRALVRAELLEFSRDHLDVLERNVQLAERLEAAETELARLRRRLEAGCAEAEVAVEGISRVEARLRELDGEASARAARRVEAQLEALRGEMEGRLAAAEAAARRAAQRTEPASRGEVEALRATLERRLEAWERRAEEAPLEAKLAQLTKLVRQLATPPDEPLRLKEDTQFRNKAASTLGRMSRPSKKSAVSVRFSRSPSP